MLSYDISHLSYEEALKVLESSLQGSTPLECQIQFDADHSRSKLIRDFVGKVFDHYEINHPWKGRFVLITDELINNAIEHGSRAGDLDVCYVRAGKHEDGQFYISLEVHDTGNGKDTPDVAKLERLRAEKLQASDNGVYMNMRGRGLFHITEKLVDQLSFSQSPHGGIAVKIEKQIDTSLPQEIKA